jgi:hypothetical protein
MKSKIQLSMKSLSIRLLVILSMNLMGAQLSYAEKECPQSIKKCPQGIQVTGDMNFNCREINTKEQCDRIFYKDEKCIKIKGNLSGLVKGNLSGLVKRPDNSMPSPNKTLFVKSCHWVQGARTSGCYSSHMFSNARIWCYAP